MISPRSTAIRIVRKLRTGGHEAFFAGGCVRDILLRRKPRDYDVATSAHPDQVQNLFEHTVAVGKAFGVIRVRLDSHEIEVATFRTEGAYRDGRHPSFVRFATAREDAERRDFTINGLFYDPIRRVILDFVGGRVDLKNGLLRAIGKATERFREDQLRLLRCIRLAAQLGFRIDPATWRAVLRMAPRIRSISAERIRDELTRLLLAPQADRGLRLLKESGLLKELLPEVQAMSGVAQPRAFHPEGDVFVHTLQVIRNLHKSNPQLAWSALLHDVGKPPTFEKACVRGRIRIRFPKHARVGAGMAGRILRRLRFSAADRDAIVDVVSNHMTFKDVKAMRLSTLKRLLARSTFDDELALHRADCAASHGKLGNVRFLQRCRREFSQEEIRPVRLVSGRDLIAMGLKPGPHFGEILRAVEEAQLDGKLQNREQVLAFVRKIISSNPN